MDIERKIDKMIKELIQKDDILIRLKSMLVELQSKNTTIWMKK